MFRSGGGGASSSERLTSFQYWYRDGGRMSGGLLPPRRDPKLFPYVTSERRPGFRLWAVVLLFVTVAGVGWYVSLLFGVLGGGTGRGGGRSADRSLLVVPTSAGLSLSDVVQTLDVSSVQVTSVPLDVSPSHEFVRAPVRYVFAEPSPVPVVTPTSTPVPRSYLVRLSSYWPDDGPEWCLTWEDGRCVSPVTSGDDWRMLEGRALACDPAWLGRLVRIPALGLALPCLDTGVSFVCSWRECTVGVISRDVLGGLYEAFVDGLY